MRKLVVSMRLGVCVAAILCFGNLFGADSQPLTVIGAVDDEKLVPIAIKGFTGEVAAVLRFDLEVQGFKIVADKDARFILAGDNAGNVNGALQDAAKAYLFNKSYEGGAKRLQAHTLSDDVVQAVQGVPGVARTRVIYRMVTGERSREIYVADFDGHSPMALTTDGRLAGAPTWGTRNQKVYYTSYQVVNGLENPTILEHNLANGSRRVFARFMGLNTGAAVGGDGRVAFVLSKGGSPDIYVAGAGWDFMNDKGDGNLLRITNTLEGESSPTWSPDGQWLCFATTINKRRVLVKASSRGGPMMQISTTGVLSPSEPSWSPDGKWIAFTTQMGDFNICVVPAEGGEAKVLARGEDPSWAPNSRTILFSLRGVNKRGLGLLDVPSKQVRLLPSFAGSASQAEWAR